jgi:CO/xanthine dehydrogenase Mo-binding subunit
MYAVGAMIDAADKLRRRVVIGAATLLGCAEGDVAIADGVIADSASGRSMSYAEFAYAAYFNPGAEVVLDRADAMQQLGGTIYENLAYDADGVPRQKTLKEYGMPTIWAAPEIEVHHLETRSPSTRIGAKGGGEDGCIATSTALMSAVEDATRRQGHVVSAVAGEGARNDRGSRHRTCRRSRLIVSATTPRPRRATSTSL